MKLFKGLLPLLSVIIFASCSQDNRIELFNGTDLDNWNIFVSDSLTEPGDLFKVEDGVIRSSGVPNGYIRTKESYGDFRLHLEWCWPEEPSNSGVLLHVQGKDMIWPISVECQLKNGNAGDIVLIGTGSGISQNDTSYLIRPDDSWYKVISKVDESSEKPAGEWNSYDITLQDGSLEVSVNGIFQNRGSELTLGPGNILLQAEGSPIEFRNIWLEPLEE